MSDSEDGSSTSFNETVPKVINVDDIQEHLNGGETANIFPRSLVKRHRLQTLRPRQSLERRSQQPVVPPIRVQSMNRSERIPLGPPVQPSPMYGLPSARPTSVREKIRFVNTPPMYIKAPPPKVVVVEKPPKIVEAPPQIIRFVLCP